MSDHTTEQSLQKVPYGYCHCGCGQKTTIAKQSHTAHGFVKGEPIKYIHGHNGRRGFHITIQDIFWQSCPQDNDGNCWEWQGSINSLGYGTISFHRKTYYAHRASYEIHNSVTLTPKDVICHKCDNPKCVNPSHLFCGTQQDNLADMIQKNRHAHGERKQNAKLDGQKVVQIRVLCAQGVLHKDIARTFGVCRQTVDNIANRKIWKHIT